MRCYEGVWSRLMRTALVASIVASCSAPDVRTEPACIRELPVSVIGHEGIAGTAFKVGPGVWVTCRHVIPPDARSCEIHGRRRDIVRRIDGKGIGGDWCVLALTQPELDPVRGSLVTGGAFAIGDDVWAAGFAGADARQGPRVLSGRLEGRLTGLGGMMRMDGDQAVSLPGMSGSPVVRWIESSEPRVIGVLHGHAEIGTSWAGLVTTTSFASCVVVDMEMHVAVEEILRERP